MLVGIGLIVYPTFSDYWNSFHQSRAIAGYAEAVAEIDEDEYKEIWDAAVRYNRDLRFAVSRFKPSAEDTKRYNEILNISNTGIIGYIEIPSIKVDLPIYHGTGEAVLQIAIGHIEGTSLPVGGAGTHSVVSGHRGLPSAKLFTNLDKLGEGDIFMIRVLNEILTYMVDQVLIVEPSDISALEIDPRMDYFTLVTCTPYGVNTHRMLVRGHRIDNLKDSSPIMATADAQQIDRNIVALFLGGPFLIFFFFRDMITGGKRSRARLARWEELDDEFERLEYGDLFDLEEEPNEPSSPTGIDPPDKAGEEVKAEMPEGGSPSGDV
ncbi:MAG: class C sortase, partial [Blautia sp.]|nr:class C sortase [Blautia sp.]